MNDKLHIKLIKSLSGRKPEHKVIASVLGLKKINQVVEHQNIPSVRGMVNKISYLLHVEECV